MADSSMQRTVEAVWRMESAKIIAKLARMLRDVGLAEELAQDSLVIALEQWPKRGVPDNPGAWLMATAKNRALDHLRRLKLLERKHLTLAQEAEALGTGVNAPSDVADDDIGDDLLRLIFIACHPVLSTEARVALTLRLLGGLTTAEIARAFLVPEPTIGQRIVRAKRTLAEARAPFEVPQDEELAARLSSVLEVIYLIFNEGYAATAGDDWMRPALCEEALRLGRILAELKPHEPEVHGLVALMEIQASGGGEGGGAAGGTSPSAPPPLPPGRPCRRTDPAPRARSRALGSIADPSWARGAGTRGGARRHTGTLRATSRHRRLPRASAYRRGDGLGADRRSL
jgi:RNA polymerase sigma factor (sigma-70 family)